MALTIYLSGIPESTSELNRLCQDLERVFIVCFTITAGERHGTTYQLHLNVVELTYPNPGAVTLRSWNGSVATILFIDLVEINASALVGSIVKIGGRVGCIEGALYIY